MKPEYLMELADIVDPDQLWRLASKDQLELPPVKRHQLDAGVGLRRHAAHVKHLRELLPLKRSLCITPLTENSTAVMSIEPPPSHMRLIRQSDSVDNSAAIEPLRLAFEAMATDSWGFRRSRKGTYVNPTVQRDWKWFQAGVRQAQADARHSKDE